MAVYSDDAIAPHVGDVTQPEQAHIGVHLLGEQSDRVLHAGLTGERRREQERAPDEHETGAER